jgi:hypothetical protein
MRSTHSDEDERKHKKKKDGVIDGRNDTSSLLSRDVFYFQIDDDEIMGAQLEREKKLGRGGLMTTASRCIAGAF